MKYLEQTLLASDFDKEFVNNILDSVDNDTECETLAGNPEAEIITMAILNSGFIKGEILLTLQESINRLQKAINYLNNENN